MPFIVNVPLSDVERGTHKVSEKMCLIQITDPLTEPPTPKHSFNRVSQYRFLDLEESSFPELDDAKITYDVAEKIAEDLKWAMDNDHDVIVHCHAGRCRSGAVAEVGIILGFDDTGRERQPNLMVKHYLMRVLGMYYWSNE